MRLDKYLADMNIGTRKEIREMVRKGRVLVGGVPVKDPGTAVSKDSEITLDGTPVSYTEFEYYMLNKPAGVISASEDPRQETVVDLIQEKKRKDLFPVGRLDKDTVGLLLITNDGALSHRLLSPRSHVDKVYYAKVAGKVSQEDVQAFAKGLYVDETLTALPAKLEILSSPGSAAQNPGSAAPVPVSEVTITIREGKFHQIKRMFEVRGMEVIYLKRLAMGPLQLDDALREGEYRALTEKEIDMLKAL